MATALSLVRDSVFGPDATQAIGAAFEMGAAFEKACQTLRDGGQPDIAKEVIAKRIIALAQEGERDPDRLCERTLCPRRHIRRRRTDETVHLGTTFATILLPN
jgi:hypothetical protein